MASSVRDGFAEMGEKYGLEDCVVAWMTAEDGLDARSLDDFAYCAATEDGLATIIENVSGVRNRVQQTSRLRQAWVKLRNTLSIGELSVASNTLENPSSPSKRIPQSDSLLFDSTVDEQRSQTSGVAARWTKPIVIASPALEALAATVQKRCGNPDFNEPEATLYLDRFKSDDLNLKFNWQRIVGRKIVFLFDTVDQNRLFEQLALLQAFQGFAVPDAEDHSNQWKTYVHSGTYSWGRASQITVVLPWYRPCQMERTSRWAIKDGKWTNQDQNGHWLDVPTALYYARLLSTPGSVPPLPGPSKALDGMPLSPLWRPPLELLFVELHEEVPVSHSVSDLGATIRMERFVPYFLEKYKGMPKYPGKTNMFILFPDRGAFDRYSAAVDNVLKLDYDHVLYIKKTRVGEKTEAEPKLFYQGPSDLGNKELFDAKDHVLIIDDFTNSGGTLFNAVNLVRAMAKSSGDTAIEDMRVTIFVSHLVALYDRDVLNSLLKKLHDLGENVKFLTTNTIPSMTNLVKDDPQVEVLDISEFIADLVV